MEWRNVDVTSQPRVLEVFRKRLSRGGRNRPGLAATREAEETRGQGKSDRFPGVSSGGRNRLTHVQSGKSEQRGGMREILEWEADGGG